MIMKFDQYNESVLDQMTGPDEETLRKKLGEDKYIEYTKLVGVQEIINKRPFGYNNIKTNATPIYLEIETELDSFIIEYINNKYVLDSNDKFEFKFNTKYELVSKIKSIALDSMDSYEKDKLEEIKVLHNQLKYIKEEMSYINKNF